MTGVMVLDDSDAPGSCKGPCWFCTHKFPTFKRTCAAFPNGIPDEIWRGENTHTEPYSGDGGIRFERRQPNPPAGKSSGRKRR